MIMKKTVTFSRFSLMTIVFLTCGLHAVRGQLIEDIIRSQIDLSPDKYDKPDGAIDAEIREVDPPIPYSPEDGSTVRVNPPPFAWVPVKNQYYQVYHQWAPRGNFTYRLEVSKDVNFKSDVITRENLDYNTYALEESLTPGKWYWRYAVERDDINYEGKTLEGYSFYSKTREFEVPADAKVWNLPDIKQVISNIPQTHPRLFIRKDELESYRERAKNGDLKEKTKVITDECDPHIGEELVAEPPFRYGIGPEKGELSGWIMRATRPPMDIMEKCGLAYLLTGDKKYGEEAKRRILHFMEWDPYGPSSYESYDEPAMWMLMRGVRAYDWTYDLFSQTEREKVEKVMKIRTSQFYDHLRHRQRYQFTPHESHSNRTLGFLGEASLCFAHEWDEADDWLKYVLTMYWNIFPVWGKEDGGWHEGPTYWSAYMSFAVHFIVSLRNATGLDLMEKPFFSNTPYFALYTNPPYAKISPFGDNEHRAPRKESQGELMYQFSTLLQDPYIRWYSDYMESGSGNNVLGVVLKDDNLKAKPPSTLKPSRYFPGVGLVSLHTELGNAEEDIHLLFHSDPYGPLSHAHADQNAFTIEAFGEPLAITSGYYPWYNSNHHRNWQWETRSSNSVTIDGWIGQPKRDPKSSGKITTFENHELYDYTVGDATQAYQGILKKFVRHIIHIPPGVYIMLDELEAPKPVTFEWWMHAFSEMDVDNENKSFIISQGDARLKVRFLQSEELNLQQFSKIPYPPERGEEDQWHLTATNASPEEAIDIITLLTPFRSNEEKEISVSNLKVTGGGSTNQTKEISLELIIEKEKYQINFLPKATVRKIKD